MKRNPEEVEQMNSVFMEKIGKVMASWIWSQVHTYARENDLSEEDQDFLIERLSEEILG